MALTYKQAQLVKSSIPALQERGETITTIFYENMLREHPELNDTFNRVNLVNGRQPRALCRVILGFASSINNISELIPRLERTCNEHCSLGVQPEHYGKRRNRIVHLHRVIRNATNRADAFFCRIAFGDSDGCR